MPVIEEDPALVEAAQGGDLAAFGHIYQRYFNRIYDFAARVTRSGRVAEEITGETFTRAVDELAGITEASRLPVELYAIAHGLAAAHDPAVPGTDSLDGAVSGTDPELAGLVWEGAGLLGPRTYAAVDLSARQGLTDFEVGAAAGMRADIAAETVARTRDRAEQAISIYVLVKREVGTCWGLRSVVGAHARDSLGRDLAELVVAHIEQCAGCARAWDRLPSPLGVLRQLAVVTPSPGLRDKVWARACRRYRWAGPGSNARRTRVASVAAVVTLVLGIAAALSIGGDGVADAEVGASPNIEATRLATAPAGPSVVTPATTTSTVPTTQVAPPATSPTRPTSTTAVPSEPPIVGIITPVEGQQLTSSSQLSFVELVAVVQDDLDEGLAVDWHEGPRYLGSGNAVTIALASGCPDSSTHTITATVTDSSGGTTSATVAFTLRCEDPDG